MNLHTQKVPFLCLVVLLPLLYDSIQSGCARFTFDKISETPSQSSKLLQLLFVVLSTASQKLFCVQKSKRCFPKCSKFAEYVEVSCQNFVHQQFQISIFNVFHSYPCVFHIRLSFVISLFRPSNCLQPNYICLKSSQRKQ